jgi:hypothetical protein
VHAPWLFVPLAAALAVGLVRQRPRLDAFFSGRAGRTAQGALWAVPLGLIVATGVVPLGDVVHTQGHFDAVFASVVQTVLGHSVATRDGALYGFYAYFLWPVFKLVGLGPVRFTLVLSLLTAASFGLVGRAVARLCERRWVAALAFPGLVYGCYFAVKHHVAVSNSPAFFDPYFQYWPLRLLTPALFVAGALAFARRPSRARRWALWGLGAFGALFNPDSGVVVLVAWLGTLVFLELTRGAPKGRVARCLAYGAEGVTAVLGAVFVFLVTVRAVFGEWPDVDLLGQSEVVYYGLGFMMLPLPVPGLWMLLVGTFLVGLALSAQRVWARAASERDVGVFVLSVLGVGLFSYYQGRSHDFVLPAPAWPAVGLWVLALDDALGALTTQGRRWWARFELAVVVGLVAVLGNFGVALATDARPTREILAARARLVTGASDDELSQDLRFLESRRPLPPEAMVLSVGSSALYHLASSTKSVGLDSQSEWITHQQLERLVEQLSNKRVELVIVEDRFFDFAPTQRGLPSLLVALTANYRRQEASPLGTLHLFVPNR